MVTERVYHSLALQMTHLHSTISKTQVPSREFEKDDNLRIWEKRNVELFS